MCCVVECIFHNCKLALEYVEICRLLEKLMRWNYFCPIFLFYDSLIRLATFRSDMQDKMRIVESNLTELLKLSKNAPDTGMLVTRQMN